MRRWTSVNVFYFYFFCDFFVYLIYLYKPFYQEKKKNLQKVDEKILQNSTFISLKKISFVLQERTRKNYKITLFICCY